MEGLRKVFYEFANYPCLMEVLAPNLYKILSAFEIETTKGKDLLFQHIEPFFKELSSKPQSNWRVLIALMKNLQRSTSLLSCRTMAKKLQAPLLSLV